MIGVLGHHRQRDYLLRAFAGARFSHAYLFSGPEYVGKLTLAKYFSALVQCEAGNIFAGEICGECISCRAASSDAHPSILIIDTEHSLASSKEKRKEISIGDIRELKRRLSFSSPGDKWRVAIIDEAEKMSGEAANAFLKLLEEPGPQTLFFLVTSAPEYLPPTIISRTQRVNFSLVPDEVLRGYLAPHMKDAAEQHEFLAIAQGRPGILVRMVEDGDYRNAERAFLRKAVDVFRSGNIAASFLFVDSVVDDAVLRDKVLEYSLRILRKELLTHVAKGEDVASVIGGIKRVERVATILATTNVNPRLALDSLMLSMASFTVGRSSQS